MLATKITFALADWIREWRKCRDKNPSIDECVKFVLIFSFLLYYARLMLSVFISFIIQNVFFVILEILTIEKA